MMNYLEVNTVLGQNRVNTKENRTVEFQNCKIFCLLWNIKVDILRNVSCVFLFHFVYPVEVNGHQNCDKHS